MAGYMARRLPGAKAPVLHETHIDAHLEEHSGMVRGVLGSQLPVPVEVNNDPGLRMPVPDVAGQLSALHIDDQIWGEVRWAGEEDPLADERVVEDHPTSPVCRHSLRNDQLTRRGHRGASSTEARKWPPSGGTEGSALLTFDASDHPDRNSSGLWAPAS
jgi:hypothetical protein